MMFVYVLQSESDDSQYVGMSADPDQRLVEHNKGLVRPTLSKRPWKRILLEAFPDRPAARIREKYLKSAAGRRFRKKIKEE